MLHDFKCTFCYNVFEEIVNSTEPNPKCPECYSATEKQISPPAQYTGALTKEINRRLDKLGAKEFKD